MQVPQIFFIFSIEILYNYSINTFFFNQRSECECYTQHRLKKHSIKYRVTNPTKHKPTNTARIPLP